MGPNSRQYLSLMYSFSVTSANIAINHILLKTRFLLLHFRCTRYGSIVNHFDVIGRQMYEFGRITQNNGHYTVQGHRFCYQSKAHMRLPISDYFELTSYFAPFPSCCILCVKSSLLTEEYLYLTHSFGVIP